MLNLFLVVLILGGVLLVVILSYFIMVYNNLVTVKLNVTKAWANIDVLLKQRHDELPKLIEVCKQYKQFEQSTLEKIVQARNRVSEARSNQDMAQLGAAEGALRLGVGQLFAVAEAYPDLKTNQSFNALQTRITGLESDIADRREYYNESVNINNVRVEQFPDLLIARTFNFKSLQLLEFDESEKQDVNIGQLFG